jgi:hypothetical protein
VNQSHAISLAVTEFQRVHETLSYIGADHQAVKQDLALFEFFKGMKPVSWKLTHTERLGFLGKDEAAKALLQEVVQKEIQGDLFFLAL